jgi:hypothetical protein
MTVLVPGTASIVEIYFLEYHKKIIFFGNNFKFEPLSEEVEAAE